MDYDIIKSRHSVRTYTLQPLSADEVVMLDSQIRRYNAEGSLLSMSQTHSDGHLWLTTANFAMSPIT